MKHSLLVVLLALTANVFYAPAFAASRSTAVNGVAEAMLRFLGLEIRNPSIESAAMLLKMAKETPGDFASLLKDPVTSSGLRSLISTNPAEASRYIGQLTRMTVAADGALVAGGNAELREEMRVNVEKLMRDITDGFMKRERLWYVDEDMITSMSYAAKEGINSWYFSRKIAEVAYDNLDLLNNKILRENESLRKLVQEQLEVVRVNAGSKNLKPTDMVDYLSGMNVTNVDEALQLFYNPAVLRQMNAAQITEALFISDSRLFSIKLIDSLTRTYGGVTKINARMAQNQEKLIREIFDYYIEDLRVDGLLGSTLWLNTTLAQIQGEVAQLMGTLLRLPSSVSIDYYTIAFARMAQTHEDWIFNTITQRQADEFLYFVRQQMGNQ